MEGKMEKDFNDIPLAESNVTLRLADIQRRCSELLLDSGDELELTLEEPVITPDSGNPYNRG
ncbi:MAG: hypothetical protein OEM30_06960 [Gammaproteobacteria bacterium]|jgi:hypothetical protein|nr:hypothetical protein [Gammaproteobacteria bacterium]MDH3812374.1 hypothetical protein [Gammaproteobacteria bacterium]